MRKGLHNKERKALDYFINELLRQLKENLILIRLFGSKARGEASQKSDIDILVVLKKTNRKIEETISGVIQQALLEQNVEFSVLTFTLEEYEKLIKERSLFMQTVQRDGIDIWKAA